MLKWEKKQLVNSLTLQKTQHLNNNLESQFREYNEIFDLVSKKTQQANKTSKGIADFTKFTTYLMINFKTMTNITPSHIAEMLIQGSTMGIVDVTKKLKEYKEADRDISALAKRLLIFEQQNVEEMKKYL